MSLYIFIDIFFPLQFDYDSAIARLEQRPNMQSLLQEANALLTVSTAPS